MIMNIMFNMVLKFMHYLCIWWDFWIFEGFVKTVRSNINTRFMFNTIWSLCKIYVIRPEI